MFDVIFASAFFHVIVPWLLAVGENQGWPADFPWLSPDLPYSMILPMIVCSFVQNTEDQSNITIVLMQGFFLKSEGLPEIQ